MRNEPYRFEIFGSDAEVDLVEAKGAAEEEVVYRRVREIFEEYNTHFNRFDSESEISRLNDSLGQKRKISEIMERLLVRAVKVWRETEGLFDPRILPFLRSAGYGRPFQKGPIAEESVQNFPDIQRPLTEDIILSEDWIEIHTPIDISGIVKSMAIADAAAQVKRDGYKNFSIDIGGDIFFGGNDHDGTPWHAAVEGVNGVKLTLSEKGIATSGITRRRWEMGGEGRHHLIHPKNPKHFSFDVLSVTVVDKDIVEADILAKKLFLLGAKSGYNESEKKNIPALFRLNGKGVLITKEMKKIAL